MATVLTYDISDGHTEVKTECLTAGFNDCINTSDGNWRKLPNTTLWHDSDDRPAVLQLFKRSVATASQKIRRQIAIEKVYLVQMGAGLIESNEGCRGPKSR